MKSLSVKQVRNFLDPQSIDTNLYCSICMEVFLKPQQTSCQHTFCHRCILHWIKVYHKSYCPLCKQDIGFQQLKKDMSISKMVNKLMVYCKQNGCKWKGTIQESKRHQSKCEYEQQHKQTKNRNMIQIICIDDTGVTTIEVDENEFKKTNSCQDWTITYKKKRQGN